MVAGVAASRWLAGDMSAGDVAGDVQAHLALFAERQPELYKWVLDELVKLADDPTIIGSAWHLLYIGQKP